MAFTVRTTEDDEQAIEVAKLYINANKKGEILLECARLIPELKHQITELNREIYRLQEIERGTQSFKQSIRQFIKS
ncbi:hypothetical protein HUO09_05700 [Vibrio sp. Y2-5]|uniref:hypothetical protein n=1 Tax=Vibrio TaxID=662 RepID=UPI00142E4E86|nr:MULTISPECIES: hypothetical protein [Vibrio]MBD0785826.1 hypothetical protein [Vibrio sp. Y2-5]NIY91146.1 hypothetical protein [Vibrio diazotrophicus]